MRVPSSHFRSSGRPDAAMTPMIDVVFLLLIFFLWTSSFQVAELLLPSQMSLNTGAGASVDLRQEDFERIVVRLESLEARTAWSINGQPVANMAALRQRLQTLAEIRADLPVIIDPDADVLLGDVVEVYDVARSVNLANIQFTTHAQLPAAENP